MFSTWILKSSSLLGRQPEPCLGDLPKVKVEQSQELLKASGLSPVHLKKLCYHFLYTKGVCGKRRTFYSNIENSAISMSILNPIPMHD